MSPVEYPFSKILVTMDDARILTASSIMFPQKGKPEIYLKLENTDNWIQVDLYSIGKIEFQP